MDDHIGHAVYVDVLVRWPLVIEDITLDEDVARAADDFQQIIVVGIVDDVVAQRDIFADAGGAAIDLNDQWRGREAGMAEHETIKGNIGRARQA